MKKVEIKKTVLAITLGSLLVCLTSPVEAQKLYRTGGLVANDQFLPSLEGFKKGMAELGYTEGKNIKYDFYNAKGNKEALKNLAQKLVQQKLDVIVTSATTATVPVAEATKGTDIPVVFLTAGNPLKFVKSYASSGNNLTGISSGEIELTAKRLELLKELVPGIKRIIVLHNPEGVNYGAYQQAVQEAGALLGLEIAPVYATSPDEVREKAAILFNRGRGEAIVVPPDAIINAALEVEDVVKQAIREKLPVIGVNPGTVKRGALATFNADYFDLGRQGARLVDKIFRGAKPSDIPIEQPFKLKLVINLKTAKAMGLKIPKEILLRADEVIE